MKKLILLFALGTFGIGSAQYHPTNSGYGNNNGWGDSGYYGNGDLYDFPDDYYYEYPTDYYPDSYYESYYNDYQRSINMVNWDRFFYEARLSIQQINMILDLNSRFSSYNRWSNYYRTNPNRWFYDRFYALERILGPRVFVIFQNRYYNGYSPVVYYTNHWRDYYRPRYRVQPMYRNVNVNVYRVDRDRNRNYGNANGWHQTRNPHNPGGLYEKNRENYPNSGRAGNSRENEGTARSPQYRNQQNGGGFRNSSPNEKRDYGIQRTENNGSEHFRNPGMRNTAPREQQNSGSQMQRSTPQQSTNPGNPGRDTEGRTTSRGGGMRLVTNP